MIKKIDVTRLWEGIPAWLILDLFGEASLLHNIKSDFLFVREIQFSQTLKFVLEDENGERFEINTKTASDHTKEAQRYLTNPVNLLKFSNLLLDRIVQNKKVIGDIQSQFQGGRRRKYLNEYKRQFNEIVFDNSSKALGFYDTLVDRIINISKTDVLATPTIAMWILEGIREYYAKEIKPFDIDFETSDGQVYQLRECSIRVSDFPPLFVYDLFGYPSVERYPCYKNVTSNVYIKDPLIRKHIYDGKPVHSSFLSCSLPECLPQYFETIAIKIIKFIDYHLLKNFNEIASMTLYDVYCSSWMLEDVPALLNHQAFWKSFISANLRRDLTQILEKGCEGSKFLKSTTVLEALNKYAKILEERKHTI